MLKYGEERKEFKRNEKVNIGYLLNNRFKYLGKIYDEYELWGKDEERIICDDLKFICNFYLKNKHDRYNR